MQLGEGAQAQGYTLQDFPQLDSTNSEAMRQASLAPCGRKWIAAAQQQAGRGRIARNWVSPPGNLYASLVLDSEFAPACAAQLGFVAGVALTEALEPLLPKGTSLQLKWPNDVLAGQGKIAGILLESTTMHDGRYVCVVGCGVNCISHPDDTPYPATGLAALGGDCGRANVFRNLGEAFTHWYATWQRPGGFAPVREQWLRRAARLGGPIQVRRPNGTQEGIFRTIDAHGRLILADGVRELCIDTGDVMFGQSGQTVEATGPSEQQDRHGEGQ